MPETISLFTVRRIYPSPSPLKPPNWWSAGRRGWPRRAGCRRRRTGWHPHMLPSLSNALDIDISSAVLGKLQTNEHRYPV